MPTSLSFRVELLLLLLLLLLLILLRDKCGALFLPEKLPVFAPLSEVMQLP